MNILNKTLATSLAPTDTFYVVTSGGTLDQRVTFQTITNQVSSQTWGNITGTLSAQTDLNTALATKASIVSPAFTGTPTASTANVGTNTTQLATTAFVQVEKLRQPTNKPLTNGIIDTSTITNTKTISADTVFTFSSAPLAGYAFGFRALINADTASHTITIPSSYSYALGTTRTTFTLPAGATIAPQWVYDGTVYWLSGETVLPSNLPELDYNTVNFGTDLFIAQQSGAMRKVNLYSLFAVSNPSFASISLASPDGSPGGQIFVNKPTASAPFIGAYDEAESVAAPAGISMPYDLGGYSNNMAIPWEAVTTANVTSSNATLADISELTTYVGTLQGDPQAYRFVAELFASPDAVGGEKYAIGGTVVVSWINYNVRIVNNTSDTIIFSENKTALSNAASPSVGATSTYIRITGTIMVTTGGTLTVQFARSGASGTSTLLRGSGFKVQAMVFQATP